MVVFPEPLTSRLWLATLVTAPVVSSTPLATMMRSAPKAALARETVPNAKVTVSVESKFPPLLTLKLPSAIFRVPSVWVTEGRETV